MSSPCRSPLNFDILALRLVRELGKLVHSGAVTERRLATIVGLSQPHLHNVVNGMRKLTTNVADQILERLDWSLTDLIESPEAEAILNRRRAHLAHGLEIPLAHSAVGPGFQLPGAIFAEISVPNSWLLRTEIPHAVSAGADPEMEDLIAPGDILLIDSGAGACNQLHDDALYVVRWSGQSLLRWLRYSSRGLYLVSSADWAEPHRWTFAACPHRHRMALVEARVIALSRPPDGRFQRPVPPSASN